jgi:OmpA-OmpF porin, OOP family
MSRLFLTMAAAIFLSSFANAQTAQTTQPSAAAASSGRVVASGVVPDEATKFAVIARLRQIYGTDRVVDQLEVDTVAAPPNWQQSVVDMLVPEIKSISQGKIEINGNNVKLRGNVPDDSAKQTVLANITGSLNRTYRVEDGLKISASRQGVLDNTLGNRTVEFESGRATLTPAGAALLDEMAAKMLQMGAARFQIIGHTDNQGNPQTNILLSNSRAEAVKQYLSSKGIPSSAISASGAGASEPVADNASPEGRARNRRIEFKLIP